MVLYVAVAHNVLNYNELRKCPAVLTRQDICVMCCISEIYVARSSNRPNLMQNFLALYRKNLLTLASLPVMLEAIFNCEQF